MKSTTKLLPLRKITNKFPRTLQVTWVINNICSNACTYCLPGLYAGTNHNYEWENAKRFIYIVLDRYESSHWSISGGEPTMSPFFKEFIKIIRDSGNTVGITTNGVKPVKYQSEIAPYLHYITYSYHPEYTDDTSFIEKVLTTNFVSPSPIRVMMHADPLLWEKSKTFIKRIKKNPTITYESVKVQPYPGVPTKAFNYSEEQLKWFDLEDAHRSNCEYPKMVRDPENFNMEATLEDVEGKLFSTSNMNPVEWINRGLTDFNGWKCNIGLESLFIGTNGHLERGNCEVGGFIGHLDKPEDIKWPRKPITCNIHLCHCATDMFATKSAPRTKITKPAKLISQKLI